jgi:hypothetical protein
MKIQGHVTISRRIVVNGVEYHSVEEMPAEARATFEKIVATQVPSALRPLLDEHGFAPVDLRQMAAGQNGAPTEMRPVLDVPSGDNNAGAVRLLLGGLFAGAAIAMYLWLR